jgi:RNA-directed DNA polymerase
MKTKLARIAEIAKERPNEAFISLYHYLNAEMFNKCHCELKANKAVGVDQVTKETYAENLEENIKGLVERLKKHSYKPQPVRRVYIPKGNGKEKRPLGIPAYEDKVVQSAIKKVLEPIYEADFLDCSYGFRPNRSMHDALKALNRIIEHGRISYVVDADIKGFFNHVVHEWMMKFLGLRIADPNMKRIINRFLIGGAMEDGQFIRTEEGTPQGAVLSPLLSNIYLHYSLDLWFEKVVKRNCKGQAELIRFADDFICCFQYKEEAENFYVALRERLGKFGLQIAEDKTKILPFGRFAEKLAKKRGQGKPGTFNFLGFTHYCSQGRIGNFRVKLKTNTKKFRTKVKQFKTWLNRIKHHEVEDIRQLMKDIAVKLDGHYRYYGITDNIRMLGQYRYQVTYFLFRWLSRRSQRGCLVERFKQLLKRYPLPEPRIYVNMYGQ